MDDLAWQYAYNTIQFMSQPDNEDQNKMDRLIQHVRMLKGNNVLDDDFSIMDVRM